MKRPRPLRRVRLDEPEALPAARPHSPRSRTRAKPATVEPDVSAAPPQIDGARQDSLDLLLGAAAISTFLFGDASMDNQKRVYSWAAKKRIPTGKFGNQIYSTKTRLRKFVDDGITGSE